MAEDLGTLSFVSWVRRGLAAGLQTPDADSGGEPQAQLRLDVTFAGSLTATARVPLIGPGDIVGLDSRVIVRTWPRPDDNDAEYQHLVLIEFDQADLPWRYTPAKDNQGRLRPWFNLVVLEEADASIQAPSGSQKLPILSTDLAKLPNLSESWAWAHTEVEGKDLANNGPAVAERLKGEPGLFVARLMSPRILQPSKSYVACLVPTFERGRLIGIGEDPKVTDSLKPAWNASSPSPVHLPVYFSWRFQTGTVGSFEQLASLIVPSLIPREVGRRDIDAHNPGLGLPQAASDPMQVEGALQSPGAAEDGPRPWPDAERTNWITKLTELLNLSKLNGLRVVTPPLYGQWYAAQTALTSERPDGSNPPWFFDLNADPRSRVGGALGTAVIQNEQQALLASGWKQVGEIESINYQLKVLQLGREASLRLYTRHVLSGHSQTFFTLTRQLHSRIMCGTKTVCAQFHDSRVGRDVFGAQWRRWTRPLGWLGRRQGRNLLPGTFVPDLIDRLNGGQHPAPEPKTPTGLFTGRAVFDTIVPGNLPKTLIIELLGRGSRPLLFWGLVLAWVARKLLVTRNGEGHWLSMKLLRFAIALMRAAESDFDVRVRLGIRDADSDPTHATGARPNPFFTVATAVPSVIPTPPRLGAAGAVDSADAAAFRAALQVLFHDRLAPPTASLPPSMDTELCRGALTTGLDPSTTLAESISSRLTLDPSVAWHPNDPLQPTFAPPEYERPMYLPLSEISKDWILPGLNKVGQDTAGLALTNQRFIEAYMVGLNHEMTRELLWNEFPTDQRGTYFRQFWDIAGHVAAEVSPVPADQLRDIKPIASWSKDAPLGGSSPRPPLPDGEYLVLVVRAQLIRRYPNVIVYAVEARPAALGSPRLSSVEQHPVFYGLMRPDVAFYGFPLTKEKVRGDANNPGWFFVLQEQPAEPKFGVTGNTINAPPPANANTAADVADQTFQDRFRVAIHGANLLPPG